MFGLSIKYRFQVYDTCLYSVILCLELSSSQLYTNPEDTMVMS